ncbi:MAG: hypothetical protein ACPGU7_02425 [Gammaproteobacteria bacterium]
MTALPDREAQIVQTHAQLIVAVVRACQNPDLRPGLEHPLKVSEQNGWTALVKAIRRILEGSRDAALVRGLDEEDAVIVSAILRGLGNPETLPDPMKQADASMAAPGLAQMIAAAGRGNTQALRMLAAMGEQMTQAGGDMARLSGLFRRLVNGERDADRLSAGMGKQGEDLLLSILTELGKLDTQ